MIKKNNKWLLNFVICFAFILVNINIVNAKTFNPLEIGLPRPVGTGTPEIASTHPVFRAYPGIRYSLRPAIYGGAYPFIFALSNQPSGMVVDEFTGEVSWSDPQASTGPITLSVTDSDGAQTETSWTIEVSTTGFVFVDSSYTGVETGSISHPYSSIENILNGPTISTDIVYFREGFYTLPLRGPQLYWVNQGCRLTSKPSAWLGYPGEAVTIDMAQHYIEGVPFIYLSSLSFINIPDWAVRALTNATYSVIRDSNFSQAAAQYTTGHAASIYSTEGSNAGVGYYAVFQNNTLTNSNGVGFVSLKDQNRALIENNIVSGVSVGTQGSKPLIENVKNNQQLTIRGNDLRSDFDAVGPLAGNGEGATMEVTFNFFKSTRVALWLGGNQASPPNKTDLYRNTIHGHLLVNYLDGNNCSASGPYTFDNNVFISDGAPYLTVDYIGFREGINNPDLCFPRTDNIIDNTFPISDVIDSDGNLLPDYYEYVGLVGKQVIYSCTVIYNGNTNTGGTVPIDDNIYNLAETVTILDNTGSLIKPGYTFSGWNTAADGSGIPYSDSDTFSVASSSVTLYAQWVANVPSFPWIYWSAVMSAIQNRSAQP